MFKSLRDTKRHRIHPDMKKGDEDAEEWKVLLDDEEDECSDSESEEVYNNKLDATKAKATGQLDKLKNVLGNTKASKEEKPPVAAPKRKNGKADAANAQNDELDPQDDAALAKEARKQDRLALSQPIDKARKWLKDIVATITAVREAQQESGTKTVKRLVPSPLQSEFAQLFSTRVIALTEMRLKMEDTLAASRETRSSRRRVAKRQWFLRWP